MIITFIGGGNMATALINGLLKSENSGLTIRVSDPSKDARKRLQASYDVETFTDSATAVRDVDVIVLAVKPQVMHTVLGQITGAVRPEQLILSIAAGITIATIKGQLSSSQAVIRSMPNTPALIGQGITGVFAADSCRDHHLQQAEKILSATGTVIWIEDETLMDVVTAISGSGPAYFFLLTEALAEAGTALGLPRETASQLAARTSFGAGAMIEFSEVEIAELRRRVTSPGGTTQVAVSVLESANLRDLVFKAAEAAVIRGRELAKGEPGGDQAK
jgi:pyrroline-5-carboxylate reductase